MPVWYASRSLKGAKRRYSVTDLEALAVVWAVKTFKSYIMGTRFKVVTDHNALKALVSKASLEGQLACWADFLMGFDFKIIYHWGKENVVANTLSHLMWNQELKKLNTMARYDMVVAKRLNVIFIPEERQKILLQVYIGPRLVDWILINFFSSLSYITFGLWWQRMWRSFSTNATFVWRWALS